MGITQGQHRQQTVNREIGLVHLVTFQILLQECIVDSAMLNPQAEVVEVVVVVVVVLAVVLAVVVEEEVLTPIRDLVIGIAHNVGISVLHHVPTVEIVILQNPRLV